MRLRSILSSTFALAFALSATSAPAAFVAFNDFSGTPMTNNTQIVSYSVNGSASGFLKNYATGLNTSVTVSFAHTGNSNGNFPALGGPAPVSGTDAYILFNGFANTVGIFDAGSTSPINPNVTLTFTGLSSSKLYDIALYNKYTAGTSRTDHTRISDVTSFTNISSVGATVTTASLTNDNTAIPSNNVNDLVHRYTNIVPGVDGDFVVTLYMPNSDFTVDFNVFRFEELADAPAVPEPSTFILAALGLAGLGLFAWRRRSRNSIQAKARPYLS
ncbi:MAG: PEP-CTERM sorting domain-containing protein [Planctomycetes bacterium]|nr:PEP-CTERM sorting domain-containing protein [Planctomycetota bacterium]